MLLSQCHHHHHHHLLFSPLLTHHQYHNHKPFLSLPSSSSSSSSSSYLLRKPTSVSVSAIPPATPSWAWMTHLADIITTVDTADGPVELPPSSTPSLLATTDNPSLIQVSASVLLTGAISVFLFRSLRRRAKRVKELQFRSSGVKKSVKEEALDTLKAMGTASIEAKGPPSPVQAFLGAISAGIISLIFYKFATTIEAALNRQSISTDFSARQITITVRTIINGLTYLATFIFGLNSLGLFLYSGQLAIKSFTGNSTENETENASAVDQSSLTNLSVESRPNNAELSSGKDEQSSNDAQ